jgi:NAD-dependent deacetylase
MRDDISTIVILTGAGTSAEPGIATFRASDGLWEDHRVERVTFPTAEPWVVLPSA